MGWFYRQVEQKRSTNCSRTMVRANVDVWKNLFPFCVDDLHGTNWGSSRESADSAVWQSERISWEGHDGFNTGILIHRCGGAHVVTCLVAMHRNSITCSTGYGMLPQSSQLRLTLILTSSPRKAQGAVCTLCESLKVDNSLCKISLTFGQSQVEHWQKFGLRGTPAAAIVTIFGGSSGS